MILFLIISFFGNYYDNDEEKPFNGILCHIKPKVSITCKGDKWTNGPTSDLICDDTPWHDVFPSYDQPGVYIDFKLNGFLVHADKFKIKGRTADNYHNMVDWSIQGIKLDGTIDSLIHSKDELASNKTKIYENPEKDKRILYSGFRIINHELDTYHNHKYGEVCSHVCITTFDVFGELYENYITNTEILHINFPFVTIFLLGKPLSS